MTLSTVDVESLICEGKFANFHPRGKFTPVQQYHGSLATQTLFLTRAEGALKRVWSNGQYRLVNTMPRKSRRVNHVLLTLPFVVHLDELYIAFLIVYVLLLIRTGLGTWDFADG